MDEEKNTEAPSSQEETASIEAEVPKLISISIEEFNKLQGEGKEFKEKYLHALAESENSRKRLQKERQDVIQHTIQSIIVDFLNPIDHLENALKYAEQASPEVRNWALGFEMILTQFKDVLSSHGITPFISEGHPFDPHFHEAVEMVFSETHIPGTVIKEHIRGYKMSNGKVIRPARVDVAKAIETLEQKN